MKSGPRLVRPWPGRPDRFRRHWNIYLESKTDALLQVNVCHTSNTTSSNADVNECLSNGGLGPCQQACTNTNGSFYCSCQPGYTFSGSACNGEQFSVSVCVCVHVFVCVSVCSLCVCCVYLNHLSMHICDFTVRSCVITAFLSNKPPYLELTTVCVHS